ncbi:F-box/kelch-repeat protein At3g23880-like [Silene latifolia]|uniref:F-box/kelch-repeat protein At3g23880-like n=1 Tax=Silene latifolia TaxID=37657 RepID=UPI003D774B4E
MGKKKRNKLSNKSTLPEEIWGEILARLPIKPILRFRRVSRLWRSLIDDPQFTSMHLKTLKDRQESRLLVLEQHVTCTTKQLCTIRRADTFRQMSKHKFSVGYYTDYEATGYINGVLCLKKYMKDYKELAKIFLWNPSLKKAFDVRLPQLAESIGNFDIDCAFGYDPIKKDYKIVASLHAQDEVDFPKRVEIYTFSDNYWERVTLKKGPCFWDKEAPKSYLDGVIYWMGIDPNKTTTKGKFPHLVSFHVGNEVFNYIELPNCDIIDTQSHERFPSILDKCIALVDIFPDYTNIWVMRGSSWSKQYTFNLQLYENCFYLRSDGNLLFGGEKGGAFSYNLRSQEKKLLAKSYMKPPIFTSDYVESFELRVDGYEDQVVFSFPLEELNVINIER